MAVSENIPGTTGTCMESYRTSTHLNPVLTEHNVDQPSQGGTHSKTNKHCATQAVATQCSVKRTTRLYLLPPPP